MANLRNNVQINEIEEVVENVIQEWIFNAPFQGAENIIFDSDSSSSESSEGEPDDNLQYLQRRTCIRNFVEITIHQYSQIQFKNHFRLCRRTVHHLIERYQQTEYLHNDESDGPVTHDRAMYMTIWYLANTETFRQIADRFDLAQSTAHKVLQNTLDFILSLMDEYIKWSVTEEEKAEINEQFSMVQNIHGIIGAIDGCHVRIRRPVRYEDYLNRKWFHRVILQGTVNTNKFFTDVYVGEPGSMHDASVLRKSPLYETATQDPQFFENYFLIGDSAYPQLPWLLAPFRDTGRLSRDQRSFNYKHSSTRVVVEQAFGLLRARFRRLIRFDNLRIDIIIKCITVPCILHNICLLEEVIDESEIDSSSESASDNNEARNSNNSN